MLITKQTTKDKIIQVFIIFTMKINSKNKLGEIDSLILLPNETTEQVTNRLDSDAPLLYQNLDTPIELTTNFDSSKRGIELIKAKLQK